MVKQAQKERQSAHRTQWAAQFAVASELSKRGYQVALTMGIHPVIDLMVISPKGVPFLIDGASETALRTGFLFNIAIVCR